MIGRVPLSFMVQSQTIGKSQLAHVPLVLRIQRVLVKANILNRNRANLGVRKRVSEHEVRNGIIGTGGLTVVLEVILALRDSDIRSSTGLNFPLQVPISANLDRVFSDNL